MCVRHLDTSLCPPPIPAPAPAVQNPPAPHPPPPTPRLEATYEIREDIADALGRVGAYYGDDGKVRFAGWARMALPTTAFKVRGPGWRAAGGGWWRVAGGGGGGRGGWG